MKTQLSRTSSPGSGGDVGSWRPDRGLFAIFSEQCARAPGAVALRAGQRRLTYRDLDAAARGVAQRLIAVGVGRGDFVALVESRSLDAVIAMLGILAAGGGYVPLDPTHAPEQLGLIARDVALKAALVSPRYGDVATGILPPELARIDLSSAIAPPAGGARGAVADGVSR